MKKSLLTLSLFFAALGAFSSNSVPSLISTEILNQTNICMSLPVTGMYDLGDNYSIMLTVTKIDDANYIFAGVVFYMGSIIGTVSGSFQTKIIDGEETMIDDSLNESFSSEDVAFAVKTRHDTLKSAIRNMR